MARRSVAKFSPLQVFEVALRPRLTGPAHPLTLSLRRLLKAHMSNLWCPTLIAVSEHGQAGACVVMIFGHFRSGALMGSHPPGSGQPS